MEIKLKKEFDWYLVHQKELLEHYEDRVVVIKCDKVIGSYNDEFTAVQETRKKHLIGTFLVQRCSKDVAKGTKTIRTPFMVRNLLTNANQKKWL